MNLTDRPALFSLVTDVLGFYGQTTSPFALSVWWEACKGMELATVRAAMTAYATDPARGHFAPKPADVIRIVRGVGEDRANLAWVDVIGQVRSVGSYGSPALDEPTRTALEAIGGWLALCRSDEDQLPFLQRQFAAVYGSVERAEERRQLLGSESPLKLA